MQPNHFFSLERVIDRQPLAVTSQTSVAEVIRLMQKKKSGASNNNNSLDSNYADRFHNSCVLIVEDARLQGIFTERDSIDSIAANRDLAATFVSEVMCREFVALRLTGSEDISTAIALLRQHQISYLPVIDNDCQLIGLISRDSIFQRIELRENSVNQAEQKSSNSLSLIDNRQQDRAVRERLSREQIVAAIALRIRQSLDLKTILNNTVDEVRQLIEADRVLIYRFQPDGSGTVTNEAVSNPQWSIADRTFADSCFQPSWRDSELKKRIFSLADINRAHLSQCHLEFLTSIQVRANIAIPIVLSDEASESDHLWGLLIVHQCSAPRNWQESELELLRLLATNVEIAIQQGELYRQAQTELNRRRQAENLYKTLITFAPVGIFQTDAKGDCIFVNAKWQAMTGRSVTETLGQGWVEALHPEDRDRVFAEWYDATRTQTEFNLEYRFRTSEDKTIWVAGNAVPLYEASGKVTGYLGTVTNISDRKRREEVLKDIASGVSVEAGANFLPSLFEYLSKTLKVDYAFVGKLIQPDADKIETIAVYGKGQIISNFEYDLADSPCGKVIERGLCVYPQAVRQLFPHIPPLEVMQAESYAGMPIFDESGKVSGLIAVVDSQPLEDLALVEEVLKIFASRATAELERQQAQIQLQTKAKQQEAIAQLGQYALAENISSLMERTVNLVALVLDVEYCKVLELLPDGKNLLLKAGVGWHQGLVGVATVRADTNSQAGYTLLGAEPVVVRELASETRFSGPDLLLAHQVVSGVSVIIAGKDKPFGILGIHTTKQRIFSPEDINFIQAIANIIAQANRRQQSEAALKTSERKFRGIFDRTFQFMGLLEPDGKIIEANQTALDFVGLTPQDVIGKPFWDTPWWSMSEESQQLLKSAVARAATGEFVRFEVDHPGTEDRVITVDFSLTPVKDDTGKVTLLIPEGRNITNLKQAEQKIRQQAALLDVANDAIMVRGLDDRISFWNQGAEKLYGWTKAEAVNKNAARLFNRESTAELSTISQTVRQRGEWQGQLNHITKAGKTITVESRWTLVKNDSNNLQAYLVVNTDITEKKQLETQFLRTQRLESLGTLAGGIAHDLNNILAPILGFSRLLPLKLTNLDEQTKEFFKIMETNAQRGAALVKQILTFARGLEGDRGIVQIRHLIAEIGQIVTETFPKTIDLNIDAPKNLWTINGDVNQLHQVLMNLAVNARDAMLEGGTLTISAENFTVDAKYTRLHLDASEGSYVLITVADTGMGIAPEIIDRIFEPFFTTKEIGRGTGLGLSTAIGIVKSHGGFIDVVSDRRHNGKGTQFKVFLPACETLSTSSAETEQIPSGNGELILVVDDESSISKVTQATLETFNYRVLTASNGIDAIATYVQNDRAIALVIMDIMMSGMNGKTAIRTLKKINPEIKIIAVSGLISSQEIIAEINSNITAFIDKPYTNEELLRTVHQLVTSDSLSMNINAD